MKHAAKRYRVICVDFRKFCAKFFIRHIVVAMPAVAALHVKIFFGSSGVHDDPSFFF
jgi:hypothetical protein